MFSCKLKIHALTDTWYTKNQEHNDLKVSQKIFIKILNKKGKLFCQTPA